MTRLRAGDTVIFKAVVTSTAPLDGGQQIMAKIEPNGETIGWCIPSENAFYPDQLKLSVGDEVTVEGRPHDKVYSIEAMFNDKQTAIKQRGCWPVEIVNTDKLRRI